MPKSHDELVKGWVYPGTTYSFNVGLRLEWYSNALGKLFFGLSYELCVKLAVYTA